MENEQVTFPNFSGHNVAKTLSESAFTPKLVLGYDFADDVMAYASVSSGFKSGGFDPRSNSVGVIDRSAPPAPVVMGTPITPIRTNAPTATVMAHVSKTRKFTTLRAVAQMVVHPGLLPLDASLMYNFHLSGLDMTAGLPVFNILNIQEITSINEHAEASRSEGIANPWYGSAYAWQ